MVVLGHSLWSKHVWPGYQWPSFYVMVGLVWEKYQSILDTNIFGFWMVLVFRSLVYKMKLLTKLLLLLSVVVVEAVAPIDVLFLLCWRVSLRRFMVSTSWAKSLAKELAKFRTSVSPEIQKIFSYKVQHWLNIDMISGNICLWDFKMDNGP